MCGIAGVLSRPGRDEDLAHTAEAMALTLSTRGPDDRGRWADAAAGVGLGHTRLAVVDLSPEGRQPMVSACGRYVIVYNGEVYGFGDLRRELEGLGHAFRGRSDTEVVLSAISQWGLFDALPRFNGMFAFGLWDRAERKLHLVRDRLGIKPLYYGWAGYTFLFGSELKALCAHPRFRAEVDPAAVAELIRWGYVPAPRAIYRGVHKLSPGTAVTVSAEAPGRCAVRTLWSAEDVAEAGIARPFDGDAHDAEDALDALLRDAVRQRMVADVPLGALLSGGVDSSLVVAAMQVQSSRPVKTFTIGYSEEDFDEAAHARAVAGHLGTDHTELVVTPAEALAVIPDLPRIYDEPLGDSSGIPSVLVARLARQEVTVALSGDGGDEVFGGYDRYRAASAMWGMLRRLPRGLRASASRCLSRVPAAAWGLALRAVGYGAGRAVTDRVYRLPGLLGAESREALYAGLVSHWDAASGMRGPADGEPPADNSPLPAAAGARKVPEFARWMMLCDMLHYLPDDVLTKVDRASMAVGLEVRVPLLDHRIVEFGCRLPLSLRLDGGQSKKLLRQVLGRYLPGRFAERGKQGFGVPVGQWLRGPLREWAEALIDERRLRAEGFFDPCAVRKTWAQHLSGECDRPYAVWDVLVFQAWLEAHGSR